MPSDDDLTVTISSCAGDLVTDEAELIFIFRGVVDEVYTVDAENIPIAATRESKEESRDRRLRYLHVDLRRDVDEKTACHARPSPERFHLLPIGRNKLGPTSSTAYSCQARKGQQDQPACASAPGDPHFEDRFHQF